MFEPPEVDHGHLGREVGLVPLGEGGGVPLDERGGLLLGGHLPQRRGQVVLPGAGEAGQARLQLLHVHARPRQRGAALAAHDHVQPGQHGLADHRAVVERLAAQRLEQHLLHLQPDLGGVAVARQVDEAGDVAAVVVAAQEQLDLLALAQPQHAHRDRQELVDRGLEQLVARERLQDLDQVLAVVAVGGQPGRVEHVAQLAPQHGDPGDRLAVGHMGEQAEKAPLADHLAVGGEQLDPDVVEVGGAVDGGPGVGLGDDQELLLARLGPHLGGQRREALGTHLVVAQDAQRRPWQRPQRLALVGVLQAVLAVAEEREVPVGEPAQQVEAVLHLRGLKRRRVHAQVLGRLHRQRPHLPEVLDRVAHVGEHPLQIALDPLEHLGVGLTVDLDVDPRLDQHLAGDVLLAAAEHPPGHVAAHPHLRMDHQIGAQVVPVELHRHRVHQERHVVGDHLHHGAAWVPAVLVECGGVGPHHGPALGADLGQLALGHRGAVHVNGVAVEQVLRRDMPVVEPEEGQSLLGAHMLAAHRATLGGSLEQLVLGLVERHFALTPL